MAKKPSEGNGAKVTEFVYERTTKNTTVFKEVPGAGQPPIIGTLYVQSWAFPSDVKRLQVLVKPA